MGNHSWKSTVREIEGRIRTITRAVEREGKTDVIENQLDDLEHRIGALSKNKECKEYVKVLKDQLDQVK